MDLKSEIWKYAKIKAKKMLRIWFCGIMFFYPSFYLELLAQKAYNGIDKYPLTGDALKNSCQEEKP